MAVSPSEPAGDGRDRGRRWLAVIIAGLAAVAVLRLALAVAEKDLEPAQAVAVAGLLLAGLIPIVLLLAPANDLRQALGRVKAVTVGSVGIELADYAGLATEEEASEDEPADTGETLFELRTALEMKLAYLAKHVFGAQPDPKLGTVIPGFLTVGSLVKDGYLSREHARIAHDILSTRSYELRSLTESERRLFRTGAEKFVQSVRAEVFSGLVRGDLERAGWRVLPAFPDRPAHRDLLVQTKGSDGRQHHVVPVFAMETDSTLFNGPLDRLKKKPGAKAGGLRLLVVPPLSEASGEKDGIEIVKLESLLAKLA